MVKEVISRVNPSESRFRQICYEWEDDMAKNFDVPIRQIFATEPPPSPPHQNPSGKEIFIKKLKNFIKKKIPATVAVKKFYETSLIEPALTQDISLPLSLCYVMFPSELSICRGSNCIPIILDIWSDGEFEHVMRLTKGFSIYYVTARDVYNRIKEIDTESNVYYIPQSISDKYYSKNFTKYRNKKIDVIHSSRLNPVLHEYMLKYISEHPNIEYVWPEPGRTYQSNMHGLIGDIWEREEYMNMIASAKVYLVGCSGMDKARQNTFGICFATPRFYEGAISGCALIGRYPDNQEFRELNMKKYCPNITSYEQFVVCLEKALTQTPEELYAQNHEFIINSLTSKRAEQIKRDLEALKQK